MRNRISLFVHMIGVVFVATVYSCVAVVVWEANAQDKFPSSNAKQDKGETFDHWQLLCNRDKQSADRNQKCRISQSVVSQKTKARLFLVRVFKGAPMVAMITTPHSIFLKPGLVLKVDERASRAYSFETCNEDGCHVGIPLDAQLLEEWRNGKHAVFHFFDGAQHRVSIPVSLAGFKSGVRALDKKSE